MADHGWARLGMKVRLHRSRLGFRTAVAFGDAIGLTSRVIGDIENGRRDNYSTGTLAAIERGLRWAPGSVQVVLEGGEPSPAPEARDDRSAFEVRQAAARQRRRRFDHRPLADIWGEWMDHYVASLRLEIEYGRRRGLDLFEAKRELSSILDDVNRLKPGERWTPPWDELEEYRYLYGVDPDSVEAGSPVEVERPSYPSPEEYARPYLQDIGAAAYEGDPEVSDPDDEVHPS